MSEGEKLPMEKKFVVGRQSPAPSQKDVGGYGASKYGRSSATARKDFSGGGRPGPEHVAISARRQQPVAQQPRNRYVDKRPRARGPNSVDQKDEVTKADPQSAPEFGSAQAWGSKKSNFNHLLNFHYESRDLYNSNHCPGAAHVRNTNMRWVGRRVTGKGSVPYNKERFLQANCQFVVRAGKDYSVHAIDPDTLVDWDLIEQVRISSHEVPSCPICLFSPKAAKITRCGHIYCWPCMLHYLSLDDKTWRKCPICYEAVHEKDLKSVTALETRHYVVGSKIEMKLMKKLRGSTRVLPASDWSLNGCFPSKVNGSSNTCYAKLLIADVDDIQCILSTEREELEQELKYEGESTLEGTYISAALKSLKDREQKLADVEKAVGSSSFGLCMNATDTAVASIIAQDAILPVATKSQKVDRSYVSAFDETVDEVANKTESGADNQMAAISKSSSSESENDNSSPCTAFTIEGGDCEQQAFYGMFQDLELEQRGQLQFASELQAGNNLKEVSDDAFYFYQAADGQHIYMHALNVRCMVKQYGSLRNCPDTIIATLVEMEPVSMDEDLRRRLRYLNHLPLTCEFIMAELDLLPPLVSQQVLEDFAEDLEKRRRNRTVRAREDKKRAYRIQAEENRKMGIDPSMRIVRSDYGRAPPVEISTASVEVVFNSPTTVVLSTSPDIPTAEVPFNRGPRTESISSQDSIPTSSSVPSFAQGPVTPGTLFINIEENSCALEMLKAGKAKPDAWPKAHRSKETGQERGVDNSDGDEFQSLAPRHQSSLSDAIQAALDSYSKESDAVAVEQTCNQPSGPAGKKKKVKKLLFSTSLPRSK